MILRFSGDVAVSVEGRFRRQAIRQVPKDFESLPAAAAVMLELIGLSTTSVRGQDDGTLVIEFSNGDVVEIYDSNESFESYQIEGGDEVIVV